MKWLYWSLGGVVIIIVAAVTSFFLFGNKTSAPAATTYGVVAQKPVPITHTARVAFYGDMMFDRSIRTHAEAHGYDAIFSRVTPVIEKMKVDGVIANLETSITNYASQSVGSKVGAPNNFIFTSSPKVAPLLKRQHIIAVSLANNHSYNFGKDGVTQTRQYLKDAGVQYFGTPYDQTATSTIVTVKGVTIGMVGYNQFLPNGAPLSEQWTVNAIKALKGKVDFIVVFAHWGNEYNPATPGEKRLAHEFIDTGADAIIGAHPHVTQGLEVYKGKQIFYSLGNFIFDQYFSHETRCGMVVVADFSTTDTDGTKTTDIAYQTKASWLNIGGTTTVLDTCPSGNVSIASMS